MFRSPITVPDSESGAFFELLSATDANDLDSLESQLGGGGYKTSPIGALVDVIRKLNEKIMTLENTHRQLLEASDVLHQYDGRLQEVEIRVAVNERDVNAQGLKEQSSQAHAAHAPHILEP